RISIDQVSGGLSEPRRGMSQEVVRAAAQVGLIGSCPVRQTGARAENGFGIDLVGNPEPRADRPRIVMVERAIARGFVDHRSETVGRNWVGTVKRHAR